MVTMLTKYNQIATDKSYIHKLINRNGYSKIPKGFIEPLAAAALILCTVICDQQVAAVPREFSPEST